jgi:hypothetical protein
LGLGKSLCLVLWHVICLSFDFLFQELLALEDHIGSVSTALTEEQFAKCVNQSVYEARNSDRDVNKIAADDVKCSICQVFFLLQYFNVQLTF